MPLRLKWIVGGARRLKSNDRSESEMIKIENVEVYGWEAAIRGMRNPMNSWDKSDSGYVTEYDERGWDADFFTVGENDLTLMRKLATAGSDHRKFMRMINVTLDITAPMFWWSEFDTYKVSTVRNSCSKMHTIHVKPFEYDDFSHEGCDMVGYAAEAMRDVIKVCEKLRQEFNATQNKKYWRALIELLPESYNMRATVQLNYEVLRNMYGGRCTHKLFEWSAEHSFCRWIESLPYSELITGKTP